MKLSTIKALIRRRIEPEPRYTLYDEARINEKPWRSLQLRLFIIMYMNS